MQATKPLILSLGVCALALTSLSTLADTPQAAKFTGPALAVGLSAGSSEIEVKNSPEMDAYLRPSSGSSYSERSSNQGYAQPTVDLSYGFALNERLVGTVGLSYDFGAVDTKTAPMLTGSSEQGPAIKLTRHRSIYVAPGLRLGREWLLYGKLGYHQITAKHQWKITKNGKTSPQQSSTLSGASIGFGANWAMTRNLELRMEAEAINFNRLDDHFADGSKTYSARPSMVRSNLLLGYRF